MRLLAVYFTLKGLSRDGKLKFSQLNTEKYWKATLLDRGLIKLDRSGKYYIIAGYEMMCNALQIKKTRCKSKKAIVKCWHVFLAFKSKNEFLNYLRKAKAETLSAQIKYAHFYRSGFKKLKRIKIDVPLAASQVSKYFGYASKSSGQRLRKKFFKIKGELEREWCYWPGLNYRVPVMLYKARIVSI